MRAAANFREDASSFYCIAAKKLSIAKNLPYSDGPKLGIIFLAQKRAQTRFKLLPNLRGHRCFMS